MIDLYVCAYEVRWEGEKFPVFPFQSIKVDINIQYLQISIGKVVHYEKSAVNILIILSVVCSSQQLQMQRTNMLNESKEKDCSRLYWAKSKKSGVKFIRRVTEALKGFVRSNWNRASSKTNRWEIASQLVNSGMIFQLSFCSILFPRVIWWLHCWRLQYTDQLRHIFCVGKRYDSGALFFDISRCDSVSFSTFNVLWMGWFLHFSILIAPRFWCALAFNNDDLTIA